MAKYGKVIYGYWDCEYCDTKQLRGDIEQCPNCGKPRNENTVFYLDPNKKEVVETNKINTKPNWICSYCNSHNEDYENTCEYCGASKADSEKNYLQLRQNHKIPVETTPENHKIPVETTPENHKIPDPRDIISKIIKTTALSAGIIILIFAIVNLVNWLSTPVEHTIIIDDISWSRTIEVEGLKTFEESDWELPANARLISKHKAIKSYEQILDHYETKTREVSERVLTGYEEYVDGYEDLGNGQFREIIKERPVYETIYKTETYEEPVYRSEPVYAMKYFYEIDRWAFSRNITTSAHDKNPYWSDEELAIKEREKSRTEAYYISGYDGEKHRQFDLSYSEWQTYNIDDKITFTTTRFGNDVISIIK